MPVRPTDAVAELRTALRYAAHGDLDRAADVRATYGVALFLAGRTRAALRALDRATADADDDVRARVLMRRAWVALVDRPSGGGARGHGARTRGHPAQQHRTWEARTLHNLGYVQLSLGRLDEAERSFTDAERIFRDEGLSEEATQALSNVASVWFVRGDLPRALEIYGSVRLSEVRDPRMQLTMVADHCDAFLAAGLTVEAVQMFERFLTDATVPDGVRADLALSLAGVRLAAGDPAAALAAATEARATFHRQDREWFELRARLVQVRARYALDDRRGLGVAAREVARRLDEEHADEAPTALVLAGRTAKSGERTALWRAASGYRNRPNALVRASAWLAAALEREEAGDRGGVLRACGRGLDALDEHRRTLGSSELRALATAHGRELAVLALRHAGPDARTLLRWSERWRATALAEPPVTPEGEVTRRAGGAARQRPAAGAGARRGRADRAARGGARPAGARRTCRAPSPKRTR